MSTTIVYQGMGDDSKPSSRVLAPPGGGSSDIFNMGAAPAQAPAPKNTNTQSSVFGAPTVEPAQQKTVRRDNDIFGSATPPAAPKPAAQKQEEEENQDIKENNETTQPPTQAAGPTINYKPKVGVNPITGQMSGAQDASAHHSSTRVKQPPGGKSSGRPW